MKTLAVTLERCSGSALFIDDKIVFSSSEERYTGKKSDTLFPQNSITEALNYSNVKSDELDQVIICGNELSLIPSILREYSTFSVNDQIRTMEEYWYPKLVLNQEKSFVELLAAINSAINSIPSDIIFIFLFMILYFLKSPLILTQILFYL